MTLKFKTIQQDCQTAYTQWKSGNGGQAKKILSDLDRKISTHILLKTMQYIIEKYHSGELRLQPEHYRDPNYRPDPRYAPYGGATTLYTPGGLTGEGYRVMLALAIDHRWTAKTASLLLAKDAFKWVQTHIPHAIAMTAFALWAPRTALLASGAIAAQKIYSLFD